MLPDIKVIIADDHAILRDGLKQILAETDDIQVIAEAENATEAIMMARKHPADVLILDISLPDRNGVEVAKILKRENPGLSILMLSMHKEDQYAVRSLKAGASGYLTKQGASSELVSAIRTVAKGKKYLSASVAESLANHLSSEEKPLHETLSDREFQTMIMIASGMTVGEIADKLCLSVKTISVYRARLLEKMHMSNNAEITHYAIKNHLIDTE
ncbi:MAG TPA: response regulator transcription factor [Methylophilaceae bacterium]|jgi:two-component system invasion response regulator UvrY